MGDPVPDAPAGGARSPARGPRGTRRTGYGRTDARRPERLRPLISSAFQANVANTSFSDPGSRIGGAGGTGSDPGARATRNGRATPLTLPDQPLAKHTRSGALAAAASRAPGSRRSGSASVGGGSAGSPVDRVGPHPSAEWWSRCAEEPARRCGLAARRTILSEGRILAGTLQHAQHFMVPGAVDRS